MKTALFISPHLDDAVFSCAGMIGHLVASGTRVIVASVFTEGSSVHEERRREDLAAAGLLGFQAEHLAVEDAPFRTPGYHSFSEILFAWHDADMDTVKAVVAHLQALDQDHAPSQVFAPLAVGTHVDHRIVHEAVRSLGWGEKVCFYEDRPYAYARGMVELRLTTLGVPGLPLDTAALLGDHRELPFVRRYFPRGNEAHKCERLLLTPALPDASLTAISTLVDCDDAAACHTAAQCYASQYLTFCGGAREHALLDRRHSAYVGSQKARCERYWSLQPPSA